MIRMLLTTTALAALLATGTVAQEATTTPAPAAESTLLNQGYQFVDTDGLASRLIGFPIYTSAAADAERLGEINDLVIDENGDVAAVIIGVGGFLGIGEKNVAVEYDQLQWVAAADNTERLVFETTQEALNAAPGIEYSEDEVGRTAAIPPLAPDTPVEGDAADTAAAQPDSALKDPTVTGAIGDQPVVSDETGVAPLERAALTPLGEMPMTAEELLGTNVYGPNDEYLGTIGDIVLAEDGATIDALVVDIGGFLGIGAKPVAIGFEEGLNFAVDDANNRFLLIDATKDQLEAQAEYNRDTYRNERDTQRLMVSAS
jgi:sporulation protein YlmC with PRC-barrel domain